MSNMSTKYTYSIQEDFPNHKVDASALQEEVRASAIVTAIDYIGTSGDVCDVWFKAALSEGDAAILDGIVGAHAGDPLPINTAQPVRIFSHEGNAVPEATSGVPGQAPAKGLGGYVPDPRNNPYAPDPDEVVSHYVDGDGALVVRGPTLTDEGSFRDDFTGSSTVTELTGTLTFTNGSPVVLGVGTLFTEELSRDFYVRLEGDSEMDWVRILRAPSDTYAELESPYQGTSASGVGERSRWIVHCSGGASISVGSSVVELTSGTAQNGRVHLERGGDYLPMTATWAASLSARVDGQSGWLGFRDDCDDPSMCCDVLFEGDDPTKVTFRSAWDGDEQRTVVSLPSGLATNQELRYKIDVSPDYCSLLVNGVMTVRHDNHIPDLYSELSLCAGIDNGSTEVSTTLMLDTVFWSNQNQIQVSSVFQAPIPIIVREDGHSLTGTLSTSATTSDQTVISYTVPAGKVFYLAGYRVDSSGTVAGVVKVGRNDMSSEPTSPGQVDGNLFRTLELAGGGSTGEVDFGSNPRKVGVSGDVIKVAVTPVDALSTVWRASIDFVLR